MMKCPKFIIAVFAAFFVGGCANVSAAGKEEIKETEGIEWKADYAVSAAFEENSIILSELSDKRVLNEIPVAYDAYKVFINMTDEENGYMLCCSAPGTDQMKKIFYVTRDRWNTYSEMDIGFMLDE